MTDDQLSNRGRALLDAARAAEPSLDGDARKRMRAGLLSAVSIGTVGAAAATATTASAAPGALGAAGGAAAATVTAAGSVTGAVAATATASVLVKAAAVLAVAGGLAMAAVWAGPDRPVAPPVPVAVPAPAPSPVVAVVVSTPPPIVAPPAPVAEEPAPSAQSPVVDVAPKPVVAPRVATPGPPVAEAAKAAPALTAKDTGDFAKELGALDHARGALSAGDPTRALADLDATPPSPAFAEERQALRIVALCAAGRVDEGRRELARFRAAFPRSLQTERARAACEGPAR